MRGGIRESKQDCLTPVRANSLAHLTFSPKRNVLMEKKIMTHLVRQLSCQGCARALKNINKGMSSFRVITVPVLLCENCDAINIVTTQKMHQRLTCGGAAS